MTQRRSTLNFFFYIHLPFLFKELSDLPQKKEKKKKKIGKLTSVESVGITSSSNEFFHSKFTRISFIMHTKSILNRFTFPPL